MTAILSTQENLQVLTEDIQNVWTPLRFGLTRQPHVVGKLAAKEDFLKEVPSVLDMPIKLPFSEIRIPKEHDTESIREIIAKSLAFEKNINPEWEKYHIYLTVHHSFVEAATTQRRAGAHIDGMQGERYPVKIPVCHSYLVSNAVPTCFFNHPFQTDLCEKIQNWFYEFDKVKDYSRSSLSKPFEINLMTAYSLHESTAATEDTIRTFVRLEFSLKQFNRIGNSVNPLFELDWDFEERPIPAHLAVSNFD